MDVVLERALAKLLTAECVEDITRALFKRIMVEPTFSALGSDDKLELTMAAGRFS